MLSPLLAQLYIDDCGLLVAGWQAWRPALHCWLRIDDCGLFNPQPAIDNRQFLMNPNTSSRFAAIFSGVGASRFRRSSGSVFDGRTLKCQSL